MFEALRDSFSGLVNRISGVAKLSDKDIQIFLDQSHISLLDADVALVAADDFVNKTGELLRSRSHIKGIGRNEQAKMVLHEALVSMLGGTKPSAQDLVDKDKDKDKDKADSPPLLGTCIMFVGLQGAGKTTTIAKFGSLVMDRWKISSAVASVDQTRPAAREQLKQLCQQANLYWLDCPTDGVAPIDMAKHAAGAFRSSDCDLLLIDTAGRTQNNIDKLEELSEIAAACGATSTWLVIDSMTGQIALDIAAKFGNAVRLDGAILTRCDGDSRGGVALSIKHVLGCEVKYLGTGEKLFDLETFNPSSFAQRILGYGDMHALLEKCQRLEMEKAAKQVKESGRIDMYTLKEQFKNLNKMGGIDAMLKFLPSKIGKELQNKMHARTTDMKHFHAVIDSMTDGERRMPEIITSSRKIRMAKGAGVKVSVVNQLLKQWKQMEQLVKTGKIQGMDQNKLEQLSKMLGKNP